MAGRFDGQINTATEAQHVDTLQFVPNSIKVDNPTSHWIFFEDPKVWVPPYKTGFIFSWTSKNQYITIDTNLTPPNITALQSVDAIVTILYTTDSLPPYAGNDFSGAKSQSLGIVLDTFVGSFTNRIITLPPGIVSVAIFSGLIQATNVTLQGMPSNVLYYNEGLLIKLPLSDSGGYSSGALLISPVETQLWITINNPGRTDVIGYQVAGIPGVQQVVGVSGGQPIAVALKTPTQVALATVGIQAVGLAAGAFITIIPGVANKQITVYGYQWSMIPGAIAVGGYTFDLEDTTGVQFITRAEMAIASYAGVIGLSASHNFVPSGLVLPVGAGLRIGASPANAGGITVQGVIDYTGPS